MPGAGSRPDPSRRREGNRKRNPYPSRLREELGRGVYSTAPGAAGRLPITLSSAHAPGPANTR